ncbi:cap-specific mRNA (nucleoside-2'-O-)-methyltransferase 2 [Anopheles bellator]|uniref:cap-specific mRNA (nucleoside-2'-O-)-methyltransferase 2 n=1 Tax=Anopheles bellator TaxID=139047 RepID=UPI002648F117|nr:cap-specific mRNA (nucleoside-2'-O-)-methyltransferase 2 [Anopheles bellator]
MHQINARSLATGSVDEHCERRRLEDALDDVGVQFEKKFHFQPMPEESVLPPLDSVFQTPPACSNHLQLQKIQLNDIKNRLNDFAIESWHEHTRRRCSSAPILYELKSYVRAEFVTQAFAKLYECLVAYELVASKSGDHLYSVHLCEAPGAFVTALNHYIRLNCPRGTRWEWFASTLNPYYEGNSPGHMIPDDRFIRHTLDSWCFGVDSTGNIMVRENRKAIIERSRKWPTVHLVTADGSIDCLDVPAEQEERVARLHLAETVVALAMLGTGGHFVLKMFTLFEHSSINLLFLLYHCFKELHVFKPCASKAGNSEVYVIAKHYRKPAGIELYLGRINDYLQSDNPVDLRMGLFDIGDLPESFVEQLTKCSACFVRWQTDVIENNIRFYGSTNDPRENERLTAFKQKTKEMFFKRYRITKILANERIVNKRGGYFGILVHQAECHGTHNQRVRASTLDVSGKILSLRGRLDHLTLTRRVIRPEAQFGGSSESTNSRPWWKEVAITVGKPVQRVENSTFTLINCLRLLNATTDLYLKIKPNNYYSPILDSADTITINVLAFPNQTNADQFEKQLFYQILLKTKELVQTRSTCPALDLQVVLENWLFLTQYSVGMLYLLKLAVFETIEQQSATRLALRRLRPDGLSNLSRIYEKVNLLPSKVAEPRSASSLYTAQRDKSIIGVVPISSLLDEDLQYAVFNYNNSLCLLYCSQLLDEMERAYKKRKELETGWELPDDDCDIRR